MQYTVKNKNIKYLVLLACIMLLGSLMVPTKVVAQVESGVSASVIRNFARISFTGESNVKFKSAVKGRQISLRFDKAVKVSAAPLLKKLKPYILSVSQSDDNRSLLLTTNNEYRIRNFVSNSSSGIDIIGLQKGGVTDSAKVEEPTKESVNKAEEPKPKKDISLENKKPLPVKKPIIEKPTDSVKQVDEAKPEDNKVAKLNVIPTDKPSVSEKEEPTEPAVSEVENNTIETKPEEKKENPDTDVVGEESKIVKSEPVQEIAAPVEKVIVEPLKESKKGRTPGKVNLEPIEDGIALTFPWDKRVAAAVFKRGDRFLILFNDRHDFDVKELLSNKHIYKAESFNVSSDGQPAQLLSIETDLVGAKVTRKKGSYDWRVDFTDEIMLPNNMLKVQPVVEPPLRPHVFIPALELGAPVKFLDPLIGDVLTAVPFYESGFGLVPKRRFVEFALLETSQGVVVQDAMPELRVVRTRGGLKITKKGGILLSENMPDVQLPTPQTLETEASESFFPYENWKVPTVEGKPYYEQETVAEFENRLWAEATTNNKKKRRKVKKRLAQFFLAQGRGVEARVLLQNMAKKEPFYFTRNKMYALLGAAYFVNEEFNRAEAAFKHATLEGEPELDFWRDILGVVLRGEGAADYIKYHDQYITHYPPYMRQKLALISSDHLINKKKYNNALKIFDTLSRAQMIEDVNDHVRFLIGRVLAGTTQKVKAREMWSSIAERTDNDYIRPRASFAIVNLDLAENDISLEEAVKKLESLRITWRGDGFEISLLNLLTRLYTELGQYREALRSYNEIVTYFPNYPKNIEITAKMGEIFRRLFNEGGADKLSPVEALALFYEFRNLTPIGAEGDKMIQNLADRLAGVDLLDRASALLQHQVEFRLSGEERSRVGARLALIHLLGRKPREALKVLELTGFGGNSEKLQHKRTLLTARALMGLDEMSRALDLVEGDGSRDAKLLGLSIHWKEKNWPKVAASAEELLGNRDDPSLPLDDGEVSILLKLAISYAFEQEQGQLQYLRDYFLPLVQDEKSKKLFSFITEDTDIDFRNLAKLTMHINKMESFLSTYRDKVKEGGLSKAVE